MEADIIAHHFADEDKAREYLEAKRWPNGPVCPHCGIENEATKLEPREDKKTHARKGVWKCRACEKQFSVTVSTIFEDSHIPLKKWLYAFHLLCASKKGMSAHQLHRMLGVTYKSAWFMAHRIRYAMSQEPLSSKLTGTVEVDETYIGGKKRTKQSGSYKYQWSASGRPKPGPGPGANPRDNKVPVVLVLQRGGRVQSIHMERVTSETLSWSSAKWWTNPRILLRTAEHIDEGAVVRRGDTRRGCHASEAQSTPRQCWL